MEKRKVKELDSKAAFDFSKAKNSCKKCWGSGVMGKTSWGAEVICVKCARHMIKEAAKKEMSVDHYSIQVYRRD